MTRTYSEYIGLGNLFGVFFSLHTNKSTSFPSLPISRHFSFHQHHALPPPFFSWSEDGDEVAAQRPSLICDGFGFGNRLVLVTPLDELAKLASSPMSLLRMELESIRQLITHYNAPPATQGSCPGKSIVDPEDVRSLKVGYFLRWRENRLCGVGKAVWIKACLFG